MKRTSFIHGVLALSVTLLFIACSKDGPAGPAGAAGPAGSAGPAGAAGPKGDTGTANVIYSDWLDVAYTPNIQGPDTLGFNATINAPKLSAAIVANGEIKVYWNINTAAAPLIVPLPYYDGFTIINVGFQLQKILLISNDNTVGTFTNSGSKFQQYRYIIIPGSVHGRMAGHPAINWDNYEEVKRYLNLPD